MLSAIFFDMDDTVLAPRDHNPWTRFKEQQGLPSELLILDGIATRPVGEQKNLLAALYNYELEMSHQSDLREGIGEMLVEFKARGIPTALLTNNNRRAAQIALKKHGLQFNLVLTRDEAAPKPAPDLLHQALLHFALEPSQAVYVGDSDNDLQASRAVGMEVYFVATPHNQQFSPRFEYTSQLLAVLLPQIKAN